MHESRVIFPEVNASAASTAATLSVPVFPTHDIISLKAAEVSHSQRSDPDLAAVVARHKEKRRPSTKGCWEQLVLPRCPVQAVLKLDHDGTGLQGPDLTLHLLRRRCYWPKMADAVREYSSYCHRCQNAKKSGIGVHQPQGHLFAGASLIVEKNFTKFEPASHGMKDVLMLTDVSTKRTMVIPTRDQSIMSITRVLIKE
ncbi:Pol polyprotein [Plakobranchus ocellatus]|uniref:Pol polyprotein n=1 Tax=Plakobranchus ocellatus TaxID=259542 RepID=A0AAV3YT53_9GAST|nr:Pol polyprotein [Plakobranchus ocellatus]